MANLTQKPDRFILTDYFDELELLMWWDFMEMSGRIYGVDEKGCSLSLFIL
jgi:hypothetical protein